MLSVDNLCKKTDNSILPDKKLMSTQPKFTTMQENTLDKNRLSSPKRPVTGDTQSNFNTDNKSIQSISSPTQKPKFIQSNNQTEATLTSLDTKKLKSSTKPPVGPVESKQLSIANTRNVDEPKLSALTTKSGVEDKSEVLITSAKSTTEIKTSTDKPIVEDTLKPSILTMKSGHEKKLPNDISKPKANNNLQTNDLKKIEVESLKKHEPLTNCQKTNVNLETTTGKTVSAVNYGSDSCRTSTAPSRDSSPSSEWLTSSSNDNFSHSLEILPPSFANAISSAQTSCCPTDNEEDSWSVFNPTAITPVKQPPTHTKKDPAAAAVVVKQTTANTNATPAIKASNAAVKSKQEQKKNIKPVKKPVVPPWLDDDDDMKELLKNRPTILQEVDHNQNRRLTAKENMAVVSMYGGVMFADGELVPTPKSLLFNLPNSEETHQDGPELHAAGLGRGGSNSSSLTSLLSGFNSPYLSEEDDLSSGYSPMAKGHKSSEPVAERPYFRKYGMYDFRFLRVLGKGSFGKVVLAQLRESNNFYAVKALRKDVVLQDDDIECTLIERKVLALGVKHPFLCHLFCTFQTDSHMFFVMEYLNGGDLMFHIQQEGRFGLDRARFYSAEIVCALRFLHRKGIVYRDLKLDNLLLDWEGHIRIVDFGMCKLQLYLNKTADTFCGTPDYMAPEIIKGMKYTHSVDWWSFGVLLYEMLIGQSPFNGCDEDELFWSICNEQPYFPRFLTREAKHLLELLLEKKPSERLGQNEAVQPEISRHPFFKPIDFVKLEMKELRPPYRPQLKTPLDVSYFDTAFTDEPIKLTPVDPSLLQQIDQAQFKGFSLTNTLYTGQPSSIGSP